jgi:hypothetical protein
MILKLTQSIVCSKGEQLRRGGSSGGRLQIISIVLETLRRIHTQWLLLQDQEDGIN